MANVGSFSIETERKLIQFGCAPKTAVEGRVSFARPFGEPPGVVVSPFWERQGAEVGHAETLGRVDLEGFSVFSDNAAPNYFVSWVAVGSRSGLGGGDNNPGRLEVGDLRLEWGRVVKDASRVGIEPSFRSEFGAPPIVQVSPFWDGVGRGVGHAETVDRVGVGSFEALSDNRGSGYSVSWLAAGPRMGASPPGDSYTDSRGRLQWITYHFEIGEMNLRIGRYLKLSGLTGAGLGLGPGHGVAPFADEPTVVVSPFWEGQHRGVGHAETLHEVTTANFQTASGNAAANYYVSYLAIGFRP